MVEKANRRGNRRRGRKSTRALGIELPAGYGLERKTGRNGDLYLYIRTPQGNRIRVRGPEGSPEFKADVADAIAGRMPNAPAASNGRTLGDAIDRLLKSDEFNDPEQIAESTRIAYAGTFNRIKARYTSVPVNGELDRDAIEKMIAGLSEVSAENGNEGLHRPRGGAGARRFLFSRFSGLMDFCRDKLRWIKVNPLAGVKRPGGSKNPGHTMSRVEIAAFREFYPWGSQPRDVMETAYRTGVRASDLVLLTRQHFCHNAKGHRQFCIVPHKTTRKGTQVTQPLTPELAEIADRLAAAPVVGLMRTLLVDRRGQAYSSIRLEQLWRKWCREAGLPDRCTLHGLRRAFAVNLAEHGATTLQIMAAGGWRTIAEVERYTQGVQRAKMAFAGMENVSWEENISENIAHTDNLSH